MMTEKCVNVAPLLRFGSAQSERLRFHTAGLTQSDNEVPALCGNGLCDLFIVVAALGQHQHLSPIVSAKVSFQVERAKVCHHALMFALIREIMCLAVALAIEGNRLEGKQDVAQNQDDVGPLMTNDLSLAMIEHLGSLKSQLIVSANPLAVVGWRCKPESL